MAARSSIDQLPPELLIEILSHLSWRQQLVVRRVSRRWQAAADASLAGRRELYISSEDLYTGLTTERLLNLLQSMPTLRRLCIDRTGTLINRGPLAGGLITVDQLCDSCPQLQAIRLDCEIGDAGVKTLLRRLPSLRSFHLDSAKFNGKCLSLLPTGLKSLSLRDLAVKGKCLSLLPTGLKSLSLPALAHSASLRHMTHCPELRHLDLSCTNVRNEELAAVVATCPQLERLKVGWCRELTADWLKELKHCPELRDLDLHYTEVRSRELAAALAACPQLERLNVYSCRGLTKDWLRELKDCPRLQELDISHLETNGNELVLIFLQTACVRLKRLRLVGVQYAQLPFLALSQTSLTHLDLSGTNTHDYNFYPMPALLPNLRDLRLHGCSSLRDSAPLLGFTSLQVLDVSGTRIDLSDVVLSSLSSLPLKALCFDGRVDQVVALLQRCATLTLLCVMGKIPNPDHSTKANLVRSPIQTDREVTLLMLLEHTHMLKPLLPRNIRVVGTGIWTNPWTKIVGW